MLLILGSPEDRRIRATTRRNGKAKIGLFRAVATKDILVLGRSFKGHWNSETKDSCQKEGDSKVCELHSGASLAIALYEVQKPQRSSVTIATGPSHGPPRANARMRRIDNNDTGYCDSWIAKQLAFLAYKISSSFKDPLVPIGIAFASQEGICLSTLRAYSSAIHWKAVDEVELEMLPWQRGLGIAMLRPGRPAASMSAPTNHPPSSGRPASSKLVPQNPNPASSSKFQLPSIGLGITLAYAEDLNGYMGFLDEYRADTLVLIGIPGQLQSCSKLSPSISTSIDSSTLPTSASDGRQ
ncbi:hypothetical protein BDQ17DRAFT_1334891 [Cyathus striatus]|nr:hypothetical protein BDQ17DRAFT_1334891 [Cyathus striatus]